MVLTLEADCVCFCVCACERVVMAGSDRAGSGLGTGARR